jgi:hypothetical protein
MRFASGLGEIQMKAIPWLVAAAFCSIGCAASAATVVGATKVHITSALNDPSQAYLQVAELVAMDFSAHDVAYAGMGGSVYAPDQYSSTSQPSNAIDGATPLARSYYDSPGIYHSQFSTGGYLNVFFAPTTLSSLSIYGRTDCCSARDVYNISIFNAAGQSLYSGVLNADNSDHVATVRFSKPTGGVPEPAAWALLVLGFGGVGAVLRQAKRQGSRSADVEGQLRHT